MNIQHILAPVDLSTCSLLLVDRAAALARQLGASLTLLHVAEVADGAAHARIAPEGHPVDASDWLEHAVAHRLEPLRDRAARAGVDARAVAVAGAIVPTILETTQRLGADMLVLSSHGRTGLARAVLGSISEEVARQAAVPVLLVRREVRQECGRASCQWCAASGLSPEEAQVAAEAEG